MSSVRLGWRVPSKFSRMISGKIFSFTCVGFMACWGRLEREAEGSFVVGE